MSCRMPSFALLRCFLLVLAIAAISAIALPTPRFGNIWSDEMALQHGLPFNISGFAHPSAILIPLIDGVPAGGSSRCGADGIFNIEFLAQPATLRDLNLQEGHVLSVCYETETSNCASIADVVFGDVFLCAGQSNMAYGMIAARGEHQEWREHLRFDAPDVNSLNASTSPWMNGEIPGIRLITVAREIGGENDVTTALNVSFTTPKYAWTRADDYTIFAADGYPWDVPFFSAICFHFGYHHHKSTGLPVGLISSSFGGTKIEMWSSREAIKQCPPPQMPVGGFQEPPTVFEYRELCLEPAFHGGRCKLGFYSFGSLFYGMIAPITHQKLRGIIWYQGESNIGASSMYRCQLQALVADYRLHFGQPNLPFVAVQLCPVGLATSDYDWTIAQRRYDIVQIDSMRRSSAFLRLAQELALMMPNTALAITADLGDRRASFGSIHPRNKREIARRLYLEFLGMHQLHQPSTFGSHGPGSASNGQVSCRSQVRPCFKHLEFGDNDTMVVVRFASPLPVMFNGTAFCIACCSQSPFEVIYKSTKIEEAAVMGNALVLEGPDTWTVHIRVTQFEPYDEPVLVAFMHTDEPQCAIYNSQGMPAGPFIAHIRSGEIVQMLHTIPKVYKINV